MTTLSAPKLLFFLFLFNCHVSFFSFTTTAAYSISVNYGTLTDNSQLRHKWQTFSKAKQTSTGLRYSTRIPTSLNLSLARESLLPLQSETIDIPSLAKLPGAQAWIEKNILSYHPKTVIRYITFGNEIMATSDKTLIVHLLPAMKALTSALDSANASSIKVSTSYPLGILFTLEQPSSGKFRKGYDKLIFAPILEFHKQTKSPFMVILVFKKEIPKGIKMSDIHGC
ncbi:glucan endo-1,3-beta-glucosidase-like [Hibiscus syriacus]|uniref:glucan endo-1,3-beta-glucosidase-like n=1 Tax=Hibiscus syriacus TaxID=106335 RepID=UPI0019227C29|nr:glucan endo-1,3-beta-glucosidase-like [Hibiscus syriacus]